MFSDELNSFGGLAGFWTEQHRIRTFRSPSISQTLAASCTGTTGSMMDLPIDLTIRMMKIGQFHHLHLRLGQRGRQVFWQLSGASRICRGRQRHVWCLHHPPQTSLFRSPHEQNGRQILEEDLPDQLRHPVRSGSTEVPVDDDHSNQNTDGIHDEGEQKVLGDQRQYQGRRGQNLADQQQKHDQREENADSQCHFLTGLRWKIEDQDAEEGDQNRGEDQIHRVEQGLASDYDVEGDVRLRGEVTLVDVQVSWNIDDIPGTTLPVIGQVHEIFVIVQGQRDLVAVEGPGPEFHDASLLIEGKVRDVDRAGTLVDRWRDPQDVSVWIDENVTFVADLVIAISAKNGRSVISSGIFS